MPIRAEPSSAGLVAVATNVISLAHRVETEDDAIASAQEIMRSPGAVVASLVIDSLGGRRLSGRAFSDANRRLHELQEAVGRALSAVQSNMP
jgi:hypothetical protein